MICAPRWLALLLLTVGGCDCQGSVTQVVVILEADPVVVEEATRLGVEVVSQNGDRTQRSVEIGATEDHEWPFRVPIVPIGDDASRKVLVVAEANDAEGESLGVQRSELSFVEGETRYVVLRFSAGCRQTPCEQGTTCIAGECADACVTPGPSPDSPRAPGPCIRERMDAGMPEDGGPPDLGPMDAGVEDLGTVDAAPVPIDCPTRIGWVEGFEGGSVPASCGAPPCETSPSGRVELVSAVSVLAPGVSPSCGSGLLRLVRFDSPSQSFFVAPVEPLAEGESIHLRAFLWVEAPDGATTSLLGLTIGDSYRDVPTAGVELEVGPDESTLVTLGDGGERSAPMSAFPLGRWVCVELTVNTATNEATVAYEGERFTGPYPAAADFVGSAAHARVGLFRVPDTGTDGTAWLDEVAVSSEPLVCP